VLGVVAVGVGAVSAIPCCLLCKYGICCEWGFSFGLLLVLVFLVILLCCLGLQVAIALVFLFCSVMFCCALACAKLKENVVVWGRNDHTTMTAPLPVCSAKLSIVGPG
jgi:hypothetical protein